MAVIWKKIKNLLSATDYFNSSSMLRFQNEEDYKTLSGGLLSLAIIIVILVAFTKEILVTLERTSIQVKSNIVKVNNPTKSRITLQPQQNQMFAIKLSGVFPTSDIQYFELIAYVAEYDSNSFGLNGQTIPIKMVQCTDAHWKGFDITSVVVDINSLFCPELGTSFQVFGKIGVGVQRKFNLYVQPCSPDTADRPCASQEQMNQFWIGYGGAITFNIYYLNTILTPDQPDYKNYYLQGSQYGYIGPTYGGDVKMQLADYSITTDQSIWPFTDEIVQNSVFVPYGLKIMNFPRPQQFPYFLFVSIIKSTDTFTYQRKVQKLSTIFSYIGGVISSFLTAFFIMNKYTSFAFEISIANELFKRQKSVQGCSKTQISSTAENEGQQNPNIFRKSMNIYFYFKYLAFDFLKDKFGQNLQSEHMEYIKQCHDQMTKQLDIKRIIKRINCLEHCIFNIVDHQKLQNLLLTQPSAIKQLKRNRLSFEIKQKDSIISQSGRGKYQKANRVNFDDKIMQDNISQQISAISITKDLYIAPKSDAVVPTINEQRKDKIIQPPHEGKLKEAQASKSQRKFNNFRNMQLRVTNTPNQMNKQLSEKEDIFEVPIQFSNLQQK